MSNYNNFPRGSEWRKWDLQVQPIKNSWLTRTNEKNIQDSIKRSCKDYIQIAKEKGIEVLGITDHNNGYSIDIMMGLRQNTWIIPGVELDTDEGWHILFFFSNEYKTKIGKETWKDVVDTFLQSCKIEPQFFHNGVPKKIELRTIDFLRKVYNEKIGLPVFAHCCSGSGFFRKGDSSSRKNITDLWLKGQSEFAFEVKDNPDHINEIREKITGWYQKKINIPIISSSDAHQSSELGSCFTWIKADPTYQGLKQIIYEPIERIKIQSSKPEEKAGYKVINSVKISHSDYSDQTILFNQNLNSIIGGKSTGKSLLLGAIAKKLDDSIEVKDNNEQYNKYSSDIAKTTNIIWNDNEKNVQRDIDYYPQAHIYNLARDKEKLIQLIDEIFKQDETKAKLFGDYERFYRDNKASIVSKTGRLFEIRDEIKEKKENLKEFGDEKGIEKEIEKINKDIESLEIDFEVQENELEQYGKLNESISKSNTLIQANEVEIIKLKEIKTKPFFTSDYEHEFILLSENTFAYLQEHLTRLEKKFTKEWESIIDYVIESLEKEISIEKDNIDIIGNKPSFIKVSEYIQNNLSYKELVRRKNVELTTLSKIRDSKKNITILEKEFNSLKNKIYQLHFLYFERLNSFIIDLSFIKDSLTIEVTIDFLNEHNELLNESINLKSKERQKLADFEFKNIDKYKEHITHIGDLLLNDELLLKSGKKSDSVFETLVSSNNFSLSYDIIYSGDSFIKMSEGKQAFVILMLLLEFSKKVCPILIDQPEDDLDNRAVFVNLVKYLKNKKKDRQIIIVTHNPNIVVGADSEQVIVANQHGIDSPNIHDRKFQYISGSLEHTRRKNEQVDNILESQGIREHVCEILEGGDIAFLKREKKYSIRNTENA